jgi:hypothetical protein
VCGLGGGDAAGYWPTPGLPAARDRRSEIRVTAIATPSSSTIRPKICAPNSELPSASGMVEESATGSPCLPGLAWVPGAGLGTEDGLIWGNRFDALPAGIVVDTPGTPAFTSGMEPIGRLEPGLYVDPATPLVVPPDPTDEPPGAALDELGDGCALVGVGLGDGEAAFTVTTGALAGTAT